MSDTIPEPSRAEQIARLAAEAAVASLPDFAGQILALQEQLAGLQQRPEPREPAGLQQQITELQEQVAGLQQRPEPREPAGLQQQLTELQEQLADIRLTYAAPTRLLANFAQQLTELQDKHESERLARIAADAELRERLAADLKLALMEAR